METKKAEQVILSEETMRKWGKLVLDECKMPTDEQAPVLDEVIDCNLRGVDTHGIQLLCNYAMRYKTLPPKPIEIAKDFRAVCMVNGGGNLGTIVSTFSMNKAVERAKEFGIGMVLAYDSSHFGAAGYYTRKAAEKGYIGYCCTTAIIDLAPWGSNEHVVGKNPFSIAFPGDEFPVVLDVACSVTARNRVKAYAREGWKIPDGWALDKNGKPTNDANEALEGLFLPMGGHKGVGIAIMIEYMIAVVCGTGFSADINQLSNYSTKQNIAHMFAAINPLCFSSVESMKEKSQQFSERYHKAKLLTGVEKIYLPGEMEWICSQKRKKEGIPVSLTIVKELDAYADTVNIAHICDIS